MELTDVNGLLCSSRPVAALPLNLPQVLIRHSIETHRARLLTAIIAGVPSEDHDTELFTDSSDAILLNELKSIIQEHSTDRSFFIPLCVQCKD
jgi:hypothetical protein